MRVIRKLAAGKKKVLKMPIGYKGMEFKTILMEMIMHI
jgi:hypothetical protein